MKKPEVTATTTSTQDGLRSVGDARDLLEAAGGPLDGLVR